jgi:hypothetical protein
MKNQFSRPDHWNATATPAGARLWDARSGDTVARILASRGGANPAGHPFVETPRSLQPMNVSNPKKNPGTAAVLSLVVPGVGQIYNGDFLRGIFWLIITPGFWIGTGGLFGWVCHVLAAMTAHHRAKLKNQALA